MQTLVIFSHGKESGPHGSKITYLGQIAQKLGAQILSPSYEDLSDPDERVERLLALDLPPHDKLILVGSSMGGYVSTVASTQMAADGLFLLAPAFYKEGYKNQDPSPGSAKTSVVCGWHDGVIPVINGYRFAEKFRAQYHVLESDHRLNSVLPEIGVLFQEFLSGFLKERSTSY